MPESFNGMNDVPPPPIGMSMIAKSYFRCLKDWREIEGSSRRVASSKLRHMDGLEDTIVLCWHLATSLL